jgi:hypothetical protein
MINKLIVSELAKVKVADISQYDTNTHTYTIPKHVDVKLEQDKYYLIKLNKMLTVLHGNDTLSSNWNNGTYPAYQYMKVDVMKVLGKMIQVNGVYYDNDNKKDMNSMWSGWLPTDQVEIIKQL